MGDLKEIIANLYKQWEQVVQLRTEESAKDPSTEPYRSQYAAREILEDMKNTLAKLEDAGSDLNGIKLNCMIGTVHYQLGCIAVDTEELQTGEDQLLAALENLTVYESRPEAILIITSTYNQLGILRSQWSDFEKAKEYLLQAKELYANYMEQVGTPPFDFSNLYDPDFEEVSSLNQVKLEKEFTHTLYYLAQVYGKLGERKHSALYCHRTLRRQMDVRDFDPIEWSLNSATLSQYFVSERLFREARHHLAAASYTMSEHEAELKKENTGEETEAKWETFRHRTADISRCWAKYGLQLLTYSQERLLNNLPDDPKGEQEFTFESLELSSFEDQITYKPLRDYDDARAVFLAVQNWVNSAAEYYSLEDHASDYVHVIQDHSQAYKLLAFFEENDDRRCRMHKRRVNLLTATIEALNPQYYSTALKELHYELGETLSEMMDLKLSQVEVQPSAQVLKKINQLVEQSISHFQSFLKLMNREGNELHSSALPEEEIRSTLTAVFHIGRLHRKFISPDRDVKAQRLISSIQAYKSVELYCVKYPEAAELMAAELALAREVLSLLPSQMDLLQQNN